MSKNRLEAFSDSVIAIVITLLAFELKVPVEKALTNYEAVISIGNIFPEFLMFVLSFITIAIMWINHHYICEKIEHISPRIMWANFLLLLSICVIPFATGFLGANPTNQIALIVYSIVMLCCSLCFTVFKQISIGRGTYTHKRENFKHIGVYSYTLAIFVAIFMPALTYFILLVPPISYILPQEN